SASGLCGGAGGKGESLGAKERPKGIYSASRPSSAKCTDVPALGSCASGSWSAQRNAPQPIRAATVSPNKRHVAHLPLACLHPSYPSCVWCPQRSCQFTLCAEEPTSSPSKVLSIVTLLVWYAELSAPAW